MHVRVLLLKSASSAAVNLNFHSTLMVLGKKKSLPYLGQICEVLPHGKLVDVYSCEIESSYNRKKL